jgi:hypothetical protein
MLELLERQTKLTADHSKIITTTSIGDISPEDVHQGQGLSSRNRAAPRDGGDERATFLLMPGHWPRVFPGLSLVGFQDIGSGRLTGPSAARHSATP